MTGDDRTRFCSECKLHVYNLSAMSEREALTLLQSHSSRGRTCIGFYRRKDGTIVFNDCATLRKMRNGLKKLMRIVASACAFVLSLGAVRADSPSTRNGLPPTTMDSFLRDADSKMIYGDAVFPETEGNLPRGWTDPFNQSRGASDKITMLTESIKASPRDAQHYIARARAYHQISKSKEALGDCNMALRIDPVSASAYDMRGQIELSLNAYGKAVKDFSRAIRLDGSLGSSYYFRAKAYEALNKVDRANADRAKAKELGYSEH